MGSANQQMVLLQMVLLQMVELLLWLHMETGVWRRRSWRRGARRTSIQTRQDGEPHPAGQEHQGCVLPHPAHRSTAPSNIARAEGPRPSIWMPGKGHWSLARLRRPATACWRSFRGVGQARSLASTKQQSPSALAVHHLLAVHSSGQRARDMCARPRACSPRAQPPWARRPPRCSTWPTSCRARGRTRSASWKR